MQIVNLVKAVKLSTPQLTVLLSAYAKGDVLLPDEYEEELKAIEENEQQEDGTNENKIIAILSAALFSFGRNGAE